MKPVQVRIWLKGGRKGRCIIGYLKINNLYKDQNIMLFRECYALEKLHGTSSHITWKIQDGKGMLIFFSGGESHQKFVQLFDQGTLRDKFAGMCDVVVYGEAYGGSCQKMSHTYGKQLKFAAFDVCINGMWLSVPQADDFVKELGLEFVDYVLIPTEVEAINRERDRDSVQAVRNGMGEGHKREGVVLRPLIELTRNDGKRVISKHKGDDFRETKAPRVIDDPVKLKVLSDAQAIADEWCTPMRVAHILQKIEDPGMEKMREIQVAMTADIKIEAEGEIVWSKPVEKAIGRLTAQLVKLHFQNALQDV